MVVNETILNKIAQESLYGNGASGKSAAYSYEIFARHMYRGSVLELGPAEGIGTQMLFSRGYDLTVVEGAEIFCKGLKEKFPSIEVIHSLFEDIHLEKKYDNIILGHVLEHVDDPVRTLAHIKQFLTPNGCVFAAVPNARSLHRQAAVIMGILPEESCFSELDGRHGHKRVYNPESFRADFLKAGLRINVFGGYWLKPLSNKQIEDSWSKEMVDAFFFLGERYPDIAAEIYVIASLPEEV